MTPADSIEEAYLQLVFAITFIHYIEEGKIGKDDCDAALTLVLDGVPFVLPSLNYPEYLTTGSYNAFQITLGSTFITLDEALEEAGFKRNPRDQSWNGQLRTIIY